MITKRRFIKHLPLVLASLALGLGVFVSVDGFRSNKATEETSAYYTPSTHYEVSDTASELASYYSSISSSDNGNTLLNKLQSLNSTKRKRTVGYSTMGTSASSSPYIYTDYVLGSSNHDSNGQVYGTQIASFYTRTAATSWNREHVWPNSHGGDNVEGDILHTRPTISSENSSRGNSFYVEGMNNSSSGWDPYTAGYNKECRGECARIILYSVVACSDFSLSDANSHSTTNANPDNMMGNMNTLIKWHFDYSPNEYEMNRNNGAEYLQGNRNPFVDHPEYVARIWSSFNSTVSNLCTNNASMYNNWTPGSYSSYGSNDAVDSTGVTISKTSASLVVDGTTTISATSSNSSTITWSTSNSSIASISSTSAASGANITITANAVGTATITAKATINNTLYTQTCTVTVTASGGGQQGESSNASINFASGGNCASTSGSFTNFSFSTSKGSSSNDPAYNSNSSELRMYYATSGNGNSLTITPATNYSITSVTITASGTSYTPSVKYNVNGGSDQTGTWNSTTMTISGISATSSFTFRNANTSSTQLRIKSIDLTLTSSSQQKTLSSIAVSTAPAKTSYNAGEYFDPTGLVIRRNYSDSTYDTYSYAGHTTEFSFSPSTALTTSNTSITITYGGKSCSQAITVAAVQKALSSISVSGQKTSFTVGDTFSFGGTVTATFNDSTTSNVTSSASFSGYNMSQVGNQTVTVSYTYSGVTKTTTYTITVNPKRTVLEEASSQGTITWSSSDATVSTGFTATVTNVQYTYYENNSLRLGTGSGGGQIRIETNVNIVSVVVTAKAYSDTRKGNLSVGGQNINVQNTNYTTFDLLTLTTPTTSLTISTASSSIRINIQSIVVNCLGSTDISSSSDCLGLESFVENYMHMDYTQNLGYCKDNTHHYYSTAKAAFNALNTHQRSLFVNNSAYAAEWARLAAWASANGESINSNNQLTQRTSLAAIQEIATNSNIIVLMAVILVVGISAIGMYVYINKKRIKE